MKNTIRRVLIVLSVFVSSQVVFAGATIEYDFGHFVLNDCTSDDLSRVKAFMSTELVKRKGLELKTGDSEVPMVEVKEVDIKGCEAVDVTYYADAYSGEVNFLYYDIVAEVEYLIDAEPVQDVFGGPVSLSKRILRNDLKSSSASPIPGQPQVPAPQVYDIPEGVEAI